MASSEKSLTSNFDEHYILNGIKKNLFDIFYLPTMRSLNWNVIVFFLLYLLFVKLAVAQVKMSEYHFYGAASSTTQFPPISNTSVQNIYKTPTGFYGAGYSSNDPAFDARGIVIVPGKYVKADTYHSNNAMVDWNDYYQYGLWLYYISGNIGTFYNVDFKYYNSTNTG